MNAAVASPEYDLLVIGSGAAGLSAAVTAAFHGLKVMVVEKDAVLGGTTAWSGGWLWVPRNPLACRAGIVEDSDKPRQYLASELGNRLADPRIETFLDRAPEMVSFFEEHTAVQWVAGNTIPDFHANPGHAIGGRSVTVAPFDGRKLGRWVDKLRRPLDLISLGGMGIASGADLAHFLNATRSPRSAFHACRRLLRHWRDLALHGRGMHLVNGNALVARLLRSALDLGVDIETGSPATRLIVVDGAVTGAIIGPPSTERKIQARHTLLACGGFPHDRNRIADQFTHAPDGVGHHSAAPEANTGDGISMAEAIGAAVSDDLENAGAWAPVSLVPRRDGSIGSFPHLIERAKPGFVAVTPDGRRFVNEADSYHDFMVALFAATPPGRSPIAWIIADHRAQRRFGLGWSKPFPFPTDPYIRRGYLKRADTLADLATQCGIDRHPLERTIETFNRNARLGDDPDFGRGRSPYNQIQGDAHHSPNPSLGTLETGPFYAVKIVPGSLGTFAGLRTDTEGRVLSSAGLPIGGLFAAGNDMSSIFGGNYPSGGITLGPAMTFGYVIGASLAGRLQPHANERIADEIL